MGGGVGGGGRALPALGTDETVGSLSPRDVPTQTQPLSCMGTQLESPWEFSCLRFQPCIRKPLSVSDAKILLNFPLKMLLKTLEVWICNQMGEHSAKVRLMWSWCVHPGRSSPSAFQEPSMEWPTEEA